MRWFSLVVLVWAPLLILSPAHGEDGSCPGAGADLEEAGVSCTWDRDAAAEEYRSGTAQGFSYRFIMMCQDLAPAPCDIPETCAVPSGTFLYAIDRRPPSSDVWTRIGYVCLSSSTELTEPTITPAMVLTQFRRLSWPQADLTIQPAGGETLVNLDTIFHTDDPGPLTQRITLLGQDITIEATPTTWTWHFDTGTTRTTHHPGAAYPHHTITHRYTTAHTTVRPSLDVTYTGRYRLNNDPTWHDIPGTHTVAGSPQPLDVHEARPTLVR